MLLIVVYLISYLKWKKNPKKTQKDSAGFLYELENALHNLGDLSISVQSSKYLSLNVEVETQILNCI